MPTDLVDVALHGAGVGVGQHECRTGIARRADGAEHVCVGVTLLDQLARPAATLRPLSDAAVLLSETHLVLEPDLDGRAGRDAVQRSGEFLREESD